MSEPIMYEGKDGSILALYIEDYEEVGVCYSFLNRRAMKRKGGNAMAMTISRDELAKLAESSGFERVEG